MDENQGYVVIEEEEFEVIEDVVEYDLVFVQKDYIIIVDLLCSYDYQDIDVVIEIMN